MKTGKENIENQILKYTLEKAGISEGINIYVSSKFHQTKLLSITPFYKPICIIKANATKKGNKR